MTRMAGITIGGLTYTQIGEVKEIGMIEIKNMPNKRSHRYVVAKKVVRIDGGYDYWYYGNYADEERAYQVAEEISGQVFLRGEA